MVAAAILLSTGVSAAAQTSACELVPDAQNPPEKILRCGRTLVVRTAHDTSYHPVDQNGTEQPNEVELDGGALMVEFHRSKRHPSFQIRTPYAVAAVRGTKWVVDVDSEKASTFVIAGRVAVSRPGGEQTVLLRAGDGADVSPDSGPIVVKRWPAARVRALLARFGQ
ncbi:MAG TPA: FecR family protein [Roseiarcus sp.]|jgi:hypothetical protein